jgi:cytochrome c-type biogenesis protein CcmH
VSIRLTIALLALVALTGQTAAQTPAQTEDARLIVPDAEQLVGPPQGTALSGQALFHRTAEVAALLRCPVCQGMSIADSPSEMAINMKAQVRELLSRGYSEKQILHYFELSYGQFVLLEPKFQGVTAMVWVLPILALVVGAAIVFVKLRKLERVPPPAELSKGSESDDPYLSRVRELVSGDKS